MIIKEIREQLQKSQASTILKRKKRQSRKSLQKGIAKKNPF